MDFSQSLRTRLRGLVSMRRRRRDSRCWWCQLEKLGQARTEIVRRHSDMGLLLATQRNSAEQPTFQLSPNDIARLVWLNKLRRQTLEPAR